MTSIGMSGVTIMIVGAVLGAMMTPGDMARAAKADDPTTFGDTPAILEQDRSLAERLFHVEWTTREGRSGTSRITGYVYIESGVQRSIESIEFNGDYASRISEALTTLGRAPRADSVRAGT